MSNANAAKGLLFLVLLLCGVGSVVGLGLSSWYNQTFITNGEIRMVQPSGFLQDRDALYAGEVNLPNSQANQNNAESHFYNAQATAVIQQSEVIVGNAYNQGYVSGALPFACVLGFIVVAVAVVFIIRKGDEQ